MPSITSWVRLEPRARDADLVTGTEARLYDPLWMLARQWQLGELDGADAGSAIVTRMRARVARLDAVRGAGGDWTVLDPDRTPLSTALAPAADEASARPPLLRRARAGRQLMRMMAAAKLGGDVPFLVMRFPLSVTASERALLDAADLRFADAMTGRVPDGDAAAATLAALLADPTVDLPASFGLPTADLAAASSVCRAWLAWRAAFEQRSESPAWQPDQLEYRFDARAGSVVLPAPRHAGGPVRWYDFDATATDAATTTSAIVATNLPSRARYRGMPARRYWELEDAAVHWPSIDAGPGDVARLLFIEFGLTFADHWLVAPLQVPAGSLVEIRSVVVTDCFGVRSLVSSAAELDGTATPWHFLELSQTGDLRAPPAGPVVLIPPAESPALTGPELDAVDFVRDDIADVLWAITRTQAGADGRPRDVTLSVPASPPSAPGSPGLAYRLGPQLPDAVQPFISAAPAARPELALARVPGRQPSSDPFLPARIVSAAAPARALRLARVQVLTRSPDGAYHLVTVRGAAPVAPLPSPTLFFDRLETSR